MDKKSFYDKEIDTYWIIFKDGPENSYQEVVPGVRIELDKFSNVIGLEIQNFSRFFNIVTKTEKTQDVYSNENIYASGVNVPVQSSRFSAND